MKRERRAKSQPGGARLPKPSDELKWKDIYKELTTFFNSDDGEKRAKDALASLVAAGCRETTVLQNLHLFCGGKPEDMHSVRMRLNFKGRKTRMLSIAARLREASSEIREAECLLADLDITTYNLVPDRAALDKYANFLDRVGNVAYRNLASAKISGRDQHLVFLCRIVEIATGRPHFPEIADLVNAVRRHYDPKSNEIETEESLRKRFDRNNQNTAVELELEMMQEFRILPIKLRD